MRQAKRGLLERWQKAWPEALKVWSRYTTLSEPLWSLTANDDEELGLTGSFAVIRMNDHSVRISLSQIEEYKLEDYSMEILAHEIGHHVFCPANLTEAGQAVAVATIALPTREHFAAQIVNMWEDLLINDRLTRLHDQRHAEIYERLNRRNSGESSDLWKLYMRTFELLWGLEPGRLCGEVPEGAQEGDARLAARMVRVYGKDWLQGVGGFAALCLPYLEKHEPEESFELLNDTSGLGEGCEAPLGLLELDGFEIVHPSQDPRVVDTLERRSVEKSGVVKVAEQVGGAGQTREPFLFGQVLKALGLKLDQHEAAVRFYREKALPHLIPFPTKEAEFSQEPLMEGTEPWDVGNPTDQIDWLESVMLSPMVIPGVTTVRRTWGVMGGADQEREPLDLDLYVDCSGSMPNPQSAMSHITLAGAIIVLSAMRTGARVQATLWSGPGQYDTTAGFVSDEKAVLRVLTGYLGGSTAFPNHILRDTYQDRRPKERSVHLLILSDEGVDTMRNSDERGRNGLEICREALANAGGGGTMVLKLWQPAFLERPFAQEVSKMGWNLYRVNDWHDMIAFARSFARLKYGGA